MELCCRANAEKDWVSSIPDYALLSAQLSIGPDFVVPATSITCVEPDGAVKLRMSDTGPNSQTPISIPSLFADRARKYAKHPAMRCKEDGNWKTWTFEEYYNDVRKVARAFIKLGLEPYHGVGIIGFNSPEWFISDLAAIMAGGLAVGIYTTNTPEACHYVAENCRAQIIVAENNVQLQKILAVRDRLPHLKAIIQYKGALANEGEGLYTWQQMLDMSSKVSDDILDDRIKAQAPNKCCTLIYTSGTTGNPKGVMLSHDNLTWTAGCVADVLRRAGLKMASGEATVSFLPVSHVAALLLDIFTTVHLVACVHFAEPDALKGSLAATLKEVRPTAFLGVPRVWEKIMEKMRETARQSSNTKRKIAVWAKDIGLRGNISMMQGDGSVPWGWTMANMIVFKKARAALGLDRCKICATAAAPITLETLQFFTSLNIPLMEMYGMSESTGPHTVSLPTAFRMGSVGKEFPGASTKLNNVDKEGNGEIFMNGRHVFMGYLNKQDKTDECVDTEGWLHSGDVGKRQDEFLHITGRIKEILITAGGENVAPVPVEDNVKEALHIISNAMLIGDKRKFLSILLTLKAEMDDTSGAPTDKLSRECIEFFEKLGVHYKTVTEVREKSDTKVLKAIQEGIDRANKKAISRAQVVQKWTILPKDFSIPGGELGPTLKVRRPIVMKMYTDTIEKFYEDGK